MVCVIVSLLLALLDGMGCVLGRVLGCVLGRVGLVCDSTSVGGRWAVSGGSGSGDGGGEWVVVGGWWWVGGGGRVGPLVLVRFDKAVVLVGDRDGVVFFLMIRAP